MKYKLFSKDVGCTDWKESGFHRERSHPAYFNNINDAYRAMELRVKQFPSAIFEVRETNEV